MLIDVHCHINSILNRDFISSNFIFVDSSIDYSSSLASDRLSCSYPFIYSSLGFHPFCIEKFDLKLLEDYKKLIIENKKIIAIGEIGLDKKADASLIEQENVLKEFLKLAQALNLAVFIHNRLDSFRILEIIDDFFNSYSRIIFHCFSYSTDFLKKILKKNGNVSFSLNALRDKREILDSLKFCPLENLFLETDSPYIKIKGKNSSPLDIKELYRFVSDIKNISFEKLESILFLNFKRIFYVE